MDVDAAVNARENEAGNKGPECRATGTWKSGATRSNAAMIRMQVSSRQVGIQHRRVPGADGSNQLVK